MGILAVCLFSLVTTFVTSPLMDDTFLAGNDLGIGDLKKVTGLKSGIS